MKIQSRFSPLGRLFVASTLLAPSGQAQTLLDENFDASDGGFVELSSGNTPVPGVYNPANGTWSMEGDDSGPSTNYLTSPEIVLTKTGGLQLSFDHRFSIEGDDWDGAAVEVSVNGGPFVKVPKEAFSQNTYTSGILRGNHVLNGTDAFNNDSAGYFNGDFISSVADLGGFEIGSTVVLRFVGAWDELTRGTGLPNWEIDTVTVEYLPDSDNDGMPDGYEEETAGLTNGTDDAAGDLDNDGLSNIREYLGRTDPNDDDSDGDTLLDGWETKTGIYVGSSDTGTDPLNPDTDGDGLSDRIETATGTFASGDDTGTDPNLADTDSDGVDDRFEILNGTDPFDDQNFPGPAPTMTWDAAADTDGDNLWPTLEAPQISGIAWDFGAPTAPVSGTSNFAAVTAWYNSPSATMESFNDAPLSAAPFNQSTNQPVSFELVFRPVDLVGNHLLFETGGNGFGLGIVINGDTLFFRAQAANNDDQRIILSHTFGAGEESEFHHIVGTLQVGDGGTNEGVLYVNGTEVDRTGTIGTLNDWAGGDNSGLGVLVGSTPTGQADFVPFTGDVALLRYYARKILTVGEVQTLYADLNTVPVTDSDSDDLPDSWERENFLDLDEVATGDPDGDGLDNLGELTASTDPNNRDSDGDGTEDNDEVTGAANPYTGGVLGAVPGDPTLPTVADTDGDGLIDTEETSDANGFVTDPTNPDTDGDGFRDGIEIELDASPLDPSSRPTIPVVTILPGLLGGDLTDPEDDGLDFAGAGIDPLANNWNFISITANDEPDFQGGEFAFNVFDNNPLGTGGGNDKWCCNPPNPELTVTVEFEEQYSLTHFTITSGNDTPARDPLDFYIEGSNDGVEFSTIYYRPGTEPAIWAAAERNTTALITLPKPADPYRFFRYRVTQTGGANHQISEIEYFGEVGVSGPPVITDLSYDPLTDMVTLTWNSKENAQYSVFATTDLIDFSLEINDSVASQGEETSFSFTNFNPGLKKQFFIVVEN